MNRIVRQVAAWALVLAVVAAIAFVLWLIISWFLGLPVQTQTPVAAFTGLLLVPIITFATTRQLERRRLLDAALREKKTILYDEMIKGLLSMFNLGKAKKNNFDILRFYATITPRLMTYGSRGVIKAWTGFRLGAAHADGNPIRTMSLFEDVLKAMRKDLGHSTFTQLRGELLKLFVNDIDRIDFKTMQSSVADANTEASI